MGRTKIVCTMGPACSTVEQMLALIDAGMDVARLNFSHGTHEQHGVTIAKLKEARAISKKPLAIMLDTKGPEIRIGKIFGEGIFVREGDRLAIVAEPIEGNAERIPVNPGFVLGSLLLGHRILLNDGYISAEVVEAGTERIVVQFLNSGQITTGRKLNCPDSIVDLAPLSDEDIKDIRFGVQMDIDLIAASFIRSAEHVVVIKKLLDELGAPDIQLISKIENHQGVANFDSILQVSDGIMIARGDLGVEVPLSKVPSLQKMMIRHCYLAGKTSITATQMLESMIQQPRPTRAEVSDVANAIYDSTSAVMLSAETAVGKYPVEAVRVMRTIVEEAERDFNYDAFFHQYSTRVYHDVPSAVTLAAVGTAYSSGGKAIFAFTHSGSTARLISRLRPKMPIIALTPKHKVYHQLAVTWGVSPCFCAEAESVEDAFAQASQFALCYKYVEFGDMVVLTAGSPFGISGTTNMMMVENIGDVLVRAQRGFGGKVYGKVLVVFSPDDIKSYQAKGHLLAITRADESYLPLLRQAKGVILQNHVDDIDSENYIMLVSKSMDIPAVVRADSACQVLKNGQLVTLDPAKGLVYKGVMLDDQCDAL